jgi:hypothetical protein
MIKYGIVVFRKDARGMQLPTTFFLLSAYIFMFNKTILLFYLFFPLLRLFMSIITQYFVNSNLHESTLYNIIIRNASEFENLKIVQLQPSGTFSAPYFHYVNCTRTCINISTIPFRLCSCFMNTIAQFSKMLRFYDCFCVFHYRFSLLF